MLASCQLKIADDYIIYVSNVRKLVSSFLVQEKYVLHYKNLQLYLRLELKMKKIHRGLELDQFKWLKLRIEFNRQKIIEAEKNACKNGKAFYNLMNNGVYDKTTENLRNRVDLRLANNKND